MGLHHNSDWLVILDVLVQLAWAKGSGNKDPLQLCLPTYRDTFRASLLSSIFIFAGVHDAGVREGF